ncbi:MAG: Dabb family protein [Bacteroidales bacterium]
MIRHIVLFKLKQFSSESDRLEAAENVLATFRALVGQIPQIRQYRIEKGLPLGAASCDVIIDSTFDNTDDLKAYQSHPAHLEAVELNKQWTDYKMSGDFEFLI